MKFNLDTYEEDKLSVKLKLASVKEWLDGYNEWLSRSREDDNA